MTDDTTRPARQTPQADIRQRGFSWIWLVPIVALGVVAWLGWQHFASKGPTITIEFNRGEGLEAGKTQIKHKSVPVGMVKSVELSKDLSHVVVTAEMDNVVDGFLGKDTKFWVVRPRFSAGNISGLDTLVSGSYIVVRPAKGDREGGNFKGLENPPVDVQDVPGTRYTLHTNRLRAVDEGSTIYYRGIEAGTVLGYRMDDDGLGIEIYVFVREPFAKFVTNETRFWNASGIEFQPTTNGLEVKTESFRALLAGGLTFDTPDGYDRTPAKADSAYRLYDSEREAKADPRGPHFPYMIQFAGQVHSLNIDAPVELMGVHVGRVTGIDQEIDAKTGAVRTPITIEIEQDRLKTLGKKLDGTQAGMNGMIDAMVRHGIRAQLASGSLVTGLKFIQLAQSDDAPLARLMQGGKYPEIPAGSAGGLDDVTAGASKLLKHVDVVVGHADELVGNLAKLTGSGHNELQDTVKGLNNTVKDLDRVLNNLDADVRPLGTQLPQLLKELKNTARSATSLLDYVDRHPQSLLLGRTDDGSSSGSDSSDTSTGRQ